MYFKTILLIRILYFYGLELLCEKCSAETISASYQIYPEVGLEVFPCLSQHVEYNRAVRADNKSTICELLGSEWNNNQVYEDGYIYMKMLSYEKSFPEAVKVTSDIPEDFQVGNGFDAVLQTLGIPAKRFSVIVNDYNANTTFLHIQFRPFDNETALRSELNGEWTEDILAPLPPFTENTTHMVSVYLQVWQWEVLFDGIPFKNYTHVYPFRSTGKQKARFWGQDVTCRSIVFHLP